MISPNADEEGEEQSCFHTLLVKMENDTTTLESSILFKMLNIQTCNYTSRHLPQRNKDKDLYTNVH